VLDVLFWLLRAEGPCSLDVLYEALGISKLNFFKNRKNFSFIFFFFNFWSSKPWIRTRNQNGFIWSKLFKNSISLASLLGFHTFRPLGDPNLGYTWNVVKNNDASWLRINMYVLFIFRTADTGGHWWARRPEAGAACPLSARTLPGRDFCQLLKR